MTLRSFLLLVFAVGFSALVLPTESSAQTTTWTFCAPEGGTCVVSGTQQVRFGGNGLYAYKTVTSSTANTAHAQPGRGSPSSEKQTR